MFCGRSVELSALEECYNRNKNAVCVLYGRNGIGKTEIVKEFVRQKKYFYYNALVLPQSEQFVTFRQQICDFTNSNAALKYEQDDVIGLLSFMCNISTKEEKLNIIIDEFQNMVKSFDSFIAQIVKLTKSQNFVNKLNVILISSNVRWIEGDMAADIGPAALAFSKIVKVKEFSIVDLLSLKNSDMDTVIKMYSIFGGVPKYTQMFDEKLSIKDNLVRLVLNSNAPLYDEATKILKNDLRELAHYNAILCTLSNGYTRLNDIQEYTGFSRPKLSVYLKNLIDIDLVEKYYSIDIGEYDNTQKGLYRIKDNFINFWYKCVFPFKSYIEFDNVEDIYAAKIEPKLTEIYEENYVKICKEYITLLINNNKIDFSIKQIGTWYGDSSVIDIVIKDEDNNVLVGKCKWSSSFNELDLDILNNDINQANIDASLVVIFSTDGFSTQVKQIAKKSGKIMLLDNSQHLLNEQ